MPVGLSGSKPFCGRGLSEYRTIRVNVVLGVRKSTLAVADWKIEKEKKLIEALSELKNLDINNPDLKNNIENLSSQKTQLEIEKSQLEDKYKSLLEEHTYLAKKLEEIQNKEKSEQKKQTEFSEKIDELNQETDTLLEEIDKWQM